jgi:hypothetical protein
MTAAMQGMIYTMGIVDPSQLEKLAGVMNNVSK